MKQNEVIMDLVQVGGKRMGLFCCGFVAGFLALPIVMVLVMDISDKREDRRNKEDR